ncbi:iron chelate uptake ABC transporter family permease subunit [Candidatus Bathyarchaeota archaeon]|nr:iron chelate uptake ABC transporter family permease subunit [Candidatus Bathyarchaeota archaeon]
MSENQLEANMQSTKERRYFSQGMMFFGTIIVVVTMVVVISMLGDIGEKLSLFSYAFMKRALVASISIGVMGGTVGVLMLLKNMVFYGEAIAHSSFAGASLAILLNINPFGLVLSFGIASAFGIGYVNNKQLLKNDVIIGIIFTFTMALAIIFTSYFINYETNIESYIFGNVLLTTRENVIVIFVATVGITVTIFILRRPLHYIMFSEEMARVAGIPVKIYNYLFLILASLVITVSLKALGAILVFAMLITPAAAAYQWTFRFERLLILSIMFGVLSSITGLIMSTLFEWGSGATIVFMSTMIFLISFAISPKRRSKTNVSSLCRFCSKYVSEDEWEVCSEDCFGFGGKTHLHDQDDNIYLVSGNSTKEEGECDDHG